MLKLSRSFVVVVALFSFGSLSAHAGGISWDGELDLILNDTGTGAYTGGTPGVSPFSGDAVWPDVCGATCTVDASEPDATGYLFSNGTGSITGLGVTSDGILSSVEIVDEAIVDQELVDIAALFGVTLTVGQVFDEYAVQSETGGEGTPAFRDWVVSFLYVTTDPFSDTSFVSSPPPNPDLVLWDIEEADNVYTALGEVGFVPEPGVALGFGCGALGLAWATRRRRVRSPAASGAE